MQPEQPAQPPTDPNNNSHPVQYDFIMNPEQPAHKSVIGSESLAIRLLIVLGGLFVLMIVAVVVIKLLGGDDGGFNKAAYTTVAQDQTELAHLADSGSNSAVSQMAKNFAVNTKLAMTSQQAALTTYVSKHGLKLGAKVLAAKQSSSIDTQLANAKSASNFDSVYGDIMQNQLVAYQKDLNRAFSSATGDGKVLLKNDYAGAQLLLEQLRQGITSN